MKRLLRRALGTPANMITLARIVLCAALAFFPARTAAFYAIYSAAGLSDAVDGAVARRTNTADEFGAKLDTLADFIFFVVCAIKLLPTVKLETWAYIWIALIAAIKAANIVSGLVIRKKPIFLHTAMNKATGLLLFALPLTFDLIDPNHGVAVVCAAATFAAIQEGHFIRTEKN